MTERFQPSPEQLALRERAKAIAQRSLIPLLEHAEPGRVNRQMLQMLGKSGLLAKLFPVARGGGAVAGAANGSASGEGDSRRAVSAMDLCLLREGLATECTEAELLLALQGLGAYPIVQSGSDELVAQWMPKVAAGTCVAAFALSEPGAGSDPGGLQLRATKKGEGWVLDGEKTWISNAPEADVYTVFARSSDELGAKGITAFVVPGKAPGLSGEHIEMVAPHPIGKLSFDSVPVPSKYVLGEVGGGFKVAMRTLDLFRPSVGAFAVGMSQRALDLACAWAKEREAFGKPIKDFQAVSHQLADMATRLRAARLLVWSAASAFDAGVERNTKNAAMAKLFATEAAASIVDSAIQILGARALEHSHPLAHLYLEVRAPRIYEGTSEIQREIIARELFRE